MFEINGKFTKALITTSPIEKTAHDQIEKLCNHPSCTEPIVIMPDVHAGCASPIGFTMPLGDSVVPNIVSVDIGCGMLSSKFDQLADEVIESEEVAIEIESEIRKLIPMGFNINKTADEMWENPEFFDHLSTNLLSFHTKYYDERYGPGQGPAVEYIKNKSDFETHIKKFVSSPNRGIKSIPSLGGGNHFIEFSRGQDGKLWLTVHTGSRNLGARVCKYHQEKAWLLSAELYALNRKTFIKTLVEGDKSLIQDRIKEYDAEFGPEKGITPQTAYLKGDSMYEYLYDMVVCQTYAEWNREIITDKISGAIGLNPIDEISTVHNYIDFSDFIIRKGAVASKIGTRLIIPLNSRDGILICEGKSNPVWNCSAPHGAGRIMSRKQANSEITLEEADEVMSGVWGSVTPPDESPLCYKDAAMIEAAIGDTATILDRLTPILNLKAN